MGLQNHGYVLYPDAQTELEIPYVNNRFRLGKSKETKWGLTNAQLKEFETYFGVDFDTESGQKFLEDWRITLDHLANPVDMGNMQHKFSQTILIGNDGMGLVNLGDDEGAKLFPFVLVDEQKEIEGKVLPALLRRNADRYGDRKVALREKEFGIWQPITWQQYHGHVKNFALGLRVLGFDKDDKLAIIGDNRPEWLFAELAAQSLGGVPLGIYQDSILTEVAYIINHSDAVLVFVEDDAQLAKVLAIRDEIPNIRKVILVNGTPPDDDWVTSYEEFLELGAEVADAALQQRLDDVDSSDTAGIVYTSGTTGVPKGAVLTHDNITFTAQSVFHSLEIRRGDINLLFLPLAHVFARTCVYASLYPGSTTTCLLMVCSPSGPLTVREATKVPSRSYSWVILPPSGRLSGLAQVTVVPSPKFQVQEVISPLETSVNWEFSPALAGTTRKAALGTAAMVMKSSLVMLSVPAGLLTLREMV